MTKVIRKFSIP